MLSRQRNMLVVNVIRLSDPFASSSPFFTSHGSGKAMAEQNKPCEQFNITPDLGGGRNCQRAGRDSHPIALTGLNSRQFLYSFHYLTKIQRTPCSLPEFRAVLGNSLLPPLSTCHASHYAYLRGFFGGFLRDSERYLSWKTPNLILTSKAENHKQQELWEASLHINTMVWPGDVPPLSGLFKIGRE